MKNFKHELPSFEDCPVCGSELTIYTNADQNVDEEPGWYAGDGDPANCQECGFEGYVSADEDGAFVTYDEGLPHNMEALINYIEKRLFATEAALRNVLAECDEMIDGCGHLDLETRRTLRSWSKKIREAADWRKLKPAPVIASELQEGINKYVADEADRTTRRALGWPEKTTLKERRNDGAAAFEEAVEIMKDQFGVDGPEEE